MSLLLLIPLFMIEGQISGRSAHQAQVIREIAESAAGAQTLLGPVCVVRYRELVEHREKDESSGREVVRQAIVEGTEVLPPVHLDIGGEARVESRSRGLYSARLYHLAAEVSGQMAVPAGIGLDPQRKILDAQAFLVLGISDPRGIGNDPQVQVNGGPRQFSTGTIGLADRPGAHLALGPIDVTKGAHFDFSFPLSLTGTDRLAIAPAGDSTTITLKSDWPHPSFQGRFLPTTRSVTNAGFEAHWQVSPLARSFDRVMKSEAGSTGETLDVDFLEPVNVYLMSDRAVRYGILFIVLTFAAFFLTEILRRLSIHPLQYLFVGLALAIFFLLLISLSEHLPFALAYAISACACVALIGTYLSGALGGYRLGVAFATGIAVLYAVLYGVLLSEDNALLMGSMLLFTALGATMLSTRRINWYRIGLSDGGMVQNPQNGNVAPSLRTEGTV
jgi:inner membrane protein